MKREEDEVDRELARIKRERQQREGIDEAEANPQASAEEEKKRKKQVEVLLEIARAAGGDGSEGSEGKKSPLFHSPAPDREAYADIVIDGRRETHPIRGRAFRQFWRHQFYKRTREGCNAEALKTAIETIAAMAEFEGDERPVFCRLAGHDNAIYIDLGDKSHRAVEVTAHGWEIIDRPPVRFVRSLSTEALPIPKRGGSIEQLRPFCNVQDHEFKLIVAETLAALRPDANYPVLVIVGEQGSCKSTLGRVIQKLIDPRIPLQRTLPRDEGDLIVAAKASHVLSFDNISNLPDWLSDAICRLATGGGAGKRKLYTDDDEILFSGRRPVFLNGIEDVATRADLVDRAVMLTLQPLDEGRRRDENEFNAKFERAAPKIFGALLDGLVAGLRNLASVNVTDKPRMADFAMWGEACGRAYWPAGTFLKAYRANVEAAAELVLDNSPVGDAVRRFMNGRAKWEGTSSELLPLLTGISGEQITKEKEWPKRANTLAGKLRRIAPTLRRMGIPVSFSRESETGKRVITIENKHPAQEQRKTSSESSRIVTPDEKYNDDNEMVRGDPDDGVTIPDDGVTIRDDGMDIPQFADKPLKNNGSDDGVTIPDDPDDLLQTNGGGQRGELADDGSIPATLWRCVQCGMPGDADGAVTEHDIGGARLRLHPQCHRFLIGHPEAAQELICSTKCRSGRRLQ